MERVKQLCVSSRAERNGIRCFCQAKIRAVIWHYQISSDENMEETIQSKECAFGGYLNRLISYETKTCVSILIQNISK